MQWKINLDGWGQGVGQGDVITEDGEIIGSWVTDENDHPSFIPLGAEAPTIHSPFLGLFCELVAEWHERTEAGQP